MMCPVFHHTCSVFASDTRGLCFQIPTGDDTDFCSTKIGLALQRCISSEGRDVVGHMGERVIVVYHAPVPYELLPQDASPT